MDGMILSAYWARKAVEKFFDTAPVINYHNIIPGYVTFLQTAEDGKEKQCLIPVWRVFVSGKELQKVINHQKTNDHFYFVDLYGKEVLTTAEIKFTAIEIGTIFKYPDGKSIMLESCDNQHHKLFIPEPHISIGIKKGLKLDVHE